MNVYTYFMYGSIFLSGMACMIGMTTRTRCKRTNTMRTGKSFAALATA